MNLRRAAALVACLCVPASALAVTGTGGTSYASTAPAPGAAHVQARRAAVDVPDPRAVHAGKVAGVESGRRFSRQHPGAVRAFRELHAHMRGGGAGTVTADPTLHAEIGTSFDANSVGSQATQSVSTSIRAGNPDTWIYAPTMYPSGGSCIEVTTAYTPSEQVVWAWDWCQSGGVAADVPINSTFMQKYTKNQNYSVQIVQTNAALNTWTAYLYNYKTSKWESLFSQSGTPQGGWTQGWDQYEIYSDVDANGQSYACPALANKRVESQSIKVKVNGKWVLATPKNADHIYDWPVSSFDCKSLTYHMVTAYSHWKAIG